MPACASATRNVITRLVSGLPKRKREKRRMVTLQACIDDSGSDWQSPHFILGGMVSEVSRWLEFSDAWDDALHKPNQKQLGYFKASEAQSRKWQFEGWTETERDERILELAEIARDHALLRFDVVIPQDLYDKHVKGQIPAEMDSPYFLCSLACVEILVKVPYGKVDVRTDFIFDEDQRLWRMAEDLFEGFKSSGVPYASAIGEVDHRDEKEFLPLQAADMEAWMFRRKLAFPSEPDPLRECFKPLSDIKRTGYTITESDVVGYMSKFRGHFTKLTQEKHSAHQRRLEIARELSDILGSV